MMGVGGMLVRRFGQELPDRTAAASLGCCGVLGDRRTEPIRADTTRNDGWCRP